MNDSPVSMDPYVSPLLAPDDMLLGLPPVHIVVRREGGGRWEREGGAGRGKRVGQRKFACGVSQGLRDALTHYGGHFE